MANKAFGVREINIIGSSGTPTIESPSNLNLNANRVAISTDVSIGGKIKSDVIVDSNKVGVGVTNPQYVVHVAGIGSTSLFVEGNALFDGNIDVAGNLKLDGNLYVTGTEFIINSQTIELDDFNVGIASDVSDNNLLTGAGIGIGNEDIRKNIFWSYAPDSLCSSENWNLDSGKVYKIGGTQVLSSTTLGVGVTNSNIRNVNAGLIGDRTESNISSEDYILYYDVTDSVLKKSTISSVIGLTGSGSGSGSGIVVKDSGTTVGTAGTIDFGDNLTVSSISSGIVTVTGASSQWETTATGIHTLSNVGIGTTDPLSALDVIGAVNFDCNDGNTFTSVGIGISTVDISTPSLNLYVPNIIYNSPGAYVEYNVGTFILNSDVISLNSLYQQTFTLPTISITSSASGLPATFTLGQNIDGSGEDHLGLIYDNFGGIPGTGGVARIFTSNGDLKIVTDYNGISTGSNITIGSEDIIFTDKTETQEYVRITSSGVGIGTINVTSALTVRGNTSLETLNVSGVSTFNDQVDIYSSVIIQGSVGINTTIYDSTFVIASGGEASSELMCLDGPSSNNRYGLFSQYANETTITSRDGNSYGTIKLNQYDGSSVQTSITIPPSGNVGIGSTLPTSKLAVQGDGLFTGIVTATTFYGNLVGSITDATNLTGGTANASSLNVSGLATISQGRIQVNAASNIRIGNLPAGSGSGRNIAIGDQVLVTLNGGQGRNIGIGELSYYDTTTGQYNIGVGVRAGQKITTGSYNVILGGYDGQTGLDIRTSSNNVVIADGEGNIRQYINSSGNVGIKTTVATEALTVSGVVSATSFYGTLNAGQLTGSLPAIDGSALVGVVATGAGVEIRDDGSIVGTAATIDFGSNLSVSFNSGVATVSGGVAGINTLGTSLFNNLSVSGVSTFNGAIDANSTSNFQGDVTLQSNLILGDNDEIQLGAGSSGDLVITHLSSTNNSLIRNKNTLGSFIIDTATGSPIEIRHSSGGEPMGIFTPNGSVSLYYDNSKKIETTGYGVSVYGGINAPTGIITASSFSGSGSGLTNIPAGQLTGTLPAIDGSALLNVNATGSGIVVLDDNVNIGSAKTVNFGTGLDVTYSTSGIATVTASGGSLQSRTTVTGVTTSIANNGIGNTNITGFKSYALMKVGLSTAGWLRLYTDSASRANDVNRSVGIDPAPGSGVIAEVITTGISTTQIISPFVMGGNLDNPADTTIYASITNLSGSTQAITANLTILQLEA